MATIEASPIGPESPGNIPLEQEPMPKHGLYYLKFLSDGEAKAALGNLRSVAGSDVNSHEGVLPIMGLHINPEDKKEIMVKTFNNNPGSTTEKRWTDAVKRLFAEIFIIKRG